VRTVLAAVCIVPRPRVATTAARGAGRPVVLAVKTKETPLDRLRGPII
jgi:hypothetical protein